ncbi:DUF2520 domain-containing protein [Bdellovibrio sp. 22V]|uniref:Rossmann-like and DUF2520 domain-containing protein n=1 Tax=Bdellovibrio TaxID=958 RepID=UPI002542F413|nr:Rossmann-like and DUF2520 domain-containing protein [Bdellovibrio sp. 22V]WII72535.1 DUF2520 domain-containing protein [Bdellovibrio sp. 22V]
MKATNTPSSFSYLIIGSGRVARHLAHYFHLLNISFDSWDRSQDPHALARKVSAATHVLLAISDTALEGFYRQHLAGHEKVLVQFSGAQYFEGMISAHPLMTFGQELYDFNFYKQIHFTLTGAASLADALPGLPNSFSTIPAQDKALYHSYCVLGGNFVTLLIAKMLSGFEELNVPNEAARIYVEKVVANTFANPNTALTGPLVRKDVETVSANLRALEQDRYHEIYQSFLKAYWPDYPRK